MTSTVTLIHVRLQALDRWAVGVIPDADATVKLPTAINPGTGRPHIPGTSLAGSLKRHLPAESTWLGDDPAGWEERTGDIPRHRSPLAILGATVLNAGIQSRGSTAIDPRRRAALGVTLREEQWVEPGPIDVIMQHDGPRDQDLVDQLLSWRPIIGRAGSSGLGRAVPTSVRTVSLDLTQAEHLRWWLSTRHTWYAAPTTTACPKDTAQTDPDPKDAGSGDTDAEPAWDVGREVLRVAWRAVDPIHVGDHEGSRGGDDQPLDPTTALKKLASIARTMRLRDRVLVPGSSWKGVYRHRVAHITTVIGMAGGESQRLCDVLFGSLSRSGLLRFADTTAPASVLTLTHVSIDRFTGGALDGGLFTVEAIKPGTELVQSITTERDLPPEVVALLTHVACDLHDGLIGIGGHTTRGYGSVAAATAQEAKRLRDTAHPLSVEALATALETLESGGGTR